MRARLADCVNRLGVEAFVRREDLILKSLFSEAEERKYIQQQGPQGGDGFSEENLEAHTSRCFSDFLQFYQSRNPQKGRSDCIE